MDEGGPGKSVAGCNRCFHLCLHRLDGSVTDAVLQLLGGCARIQRVQPVFVPVDNRHLFRCCDQAAVDRPGVADSVRDSGRWNPDCDLRDRAAFWLGSSVERSSVEPNFRLVW